MGNYKVITNDEQPIVESGLGNRSRVLAGAANGTTRMSVVERWLAPGVEVGPHRHPAGVEEVIWVRAGTAEFCVDGEAATVGTDHTVVIPPLSNHSIRSVGVDELWLFTRYSSATPTVLGEDSEVSSAQPPWLLGY
jgi:mannose-6-phosphate isomerase-like protein (cupin superfamily)